MDSKTVYGIRGIKRLNTFKSDVTVKGQKCFAKFALKECILFLLTAVVYLLLTIFEGLSRVVKEITKAFLNGNMMQKVYM